MRQWRRNIHSTCGVGNAGNVTIRAASLFIADNGRILSETFASGNGGNVTVSVDGKLYLDGSNAENFTGVFFLGGEGKQRCCREHKRQRERFVDHRQRRDNGRDVRIG